MLDFFDTLQQYDLLPIEGDEIERKDDGFFTEVENPWFIELIQDWPWIIRAYEITKALHLLWNLQTLHENVFFAGVENSFGKLKRAQSPSNIKTVIFQ